MPIDAMKSFKEKKMDEDIQRFLGCTWLIWSVVFVGVTIFTGGTFRTEVTFVPSTANAAVEATSFEEDYGVRHWMLGLIKGKQLDLDAGLARFVRQGEQVTKLTIVTKHTIIDLLLTGLTLGIYSPETVTIRGTVGRVEAGSTEDGAESASALLEAPR